MDLVKKIFMVLIILFFLPGISIADELDDQLPADTPSQIKEKAREVIRLGVENQGVVKITQTMLENSFTEQQMLRAYEILGEAKMKNTPEDQIMNKLYEGVAKRVRSEKIIMAMEKVHSRYQTAEGISQRLNIDADQSNIMTGHIAECMAAGITDEDMTRIREMLNAMSKDQSGKGFAGLAEQAFKTSKTMARMGVESGAVAEVVNNALRNGYDPNKMKRLEKAFIVQARTGSNPSGLANAFARGIREGISIDDLSRPGFFNSGNTMRGNGPDGNFGNSNGAAGQGNMTGAGGSGHGSGGTGHSSGGGGRGGR